MKLEIIKDQTFLPASKDFLERFLEFITKDLLKREILSSDSNKKLVLVFVSPATIQKLNKEFLNKDAVTDVLSFDPIEASSFGELILCSEKIKSQSKKHKLSLEEETVYLVLHGFLHLLGFHHEDDKTEAKKMFKIQDEIFSSWKELAH